MHSRQLKSALIIATTFVLVWMMGIAAHGFLGDVWNAVTSVATAPVKAAGWVIGQGANEAVDPALDNAFRRLRETSDHALNRFDEIGKDRLIQLDEIAKNRLNQIDVILGKNLTEVDQILDDKLLKLEALASEILDREADILDVNITRVEQILDRSLDRLQDIETNAFNRVDAALQDQVPFAASQVVQTVVFGLGICVLILVLVGFLGYQLVKKAADTDSQSAKYKKMGPWGKLKTNLTESMPIRCTPIDLPPRVIPVFKLRYAGPPGQPHSLAEA